MYKKSIIAAKLAAHLAEGDSVAVDGHVLSIAEQDRLLDAFEANDITLITERDLLTEVWTDRPALPAARAPRASRPAHAGLRRTGARGVQARHN